MKPLGCPSLEVPTYSKELLRAMRYGNDSEFPPSVLAICSHVQIGWLAGLQGTVGAQRNSAYCHIQAHPPKALTL